MERSVPLTLLIWQTLTDPVVRGDTKLRNESLRLLMPALNWHKQKKGDHLIPNSFFFRRISLFTCLYQLRSDGVLDVTI